MSTDPDCIFCRIVAGEIPADIVYESGSVIAFRDLEPQAPVHLLVIPRTHQPNAGALAAADPEAPARLFDAAREIAARDGLDGGYRLVFNTGADAHQSVFHVHMHLLAGRALGWPPG